MDCETRFQGFDDWQVVCRFLPAGREETARERLCFANSTAAKGYFVMSYAVTPRGAVKTNPSSLTLAFTLMSLRVIVVIGLSSALGTPSYSSRRFLPDSG